MLRKEDIVIKYIDTKRQLTDIFTKPFDTFILVLCRGNIVFAIPMTWFEGELAFYLVYTLSSSLHISFIST
jgi:hypothetical protein